jgi:hypothetical protein
MMSVSVCRGEVVRCYGRKWTVLRVSDVEPAILCKEGDPPRWGGRTNWFYSDELSADAEPEEGALR